MNDQPETSAAAQPCVLVCVTGCIAAYKSCEIVRFLQKAGARVKVLMTEHATRFVDPVTFRALTHEKVALGLFDDPEDPIHHISLAQEADVVLVAPATANILAKMAHGIADDLMSTTLLATPAPIVVAPAMNSGMWRAAATRENVAVLKGRGIAFVGPDSGYLACSDIDEGRLADPERIARAALDALPRSHELAGERVLITAGPTFEPIDPVRFIGNRSSGKMGIALAEAARDLGADEVTLVLGPTAIAAPSGVRVVSVETASQMHDAARAAFERATLAVCAAAVSDYRPAVLSQHKLKKEDGPLEEISVVPTVDILAALAREKGPRRVIGFAAETDDLLVHARSKLARKGCDALVANDVTLPDSGFGSDTNKAWWIDAQGEEELPTLTKRALAEEILTRAHALAAAV
ncbi:bifunctional phosphopantothenoylcysteine decarboxylase/phosphopantothenate--cysteine ligase CoaBC [Collinsella intestinalis]|uniref:bifunctional phosphopantothenoylcysteine decarboxylase/phosphopantothenate--cysteine ligase CoaBC n=1 Tax=Collinsella intestinalis TaxID=147207 RepID=UPI0025A34DE6|nr:bifunctional phosphopantothenoylcysteine decarboxylase/phosphopantothenate--cysteine ligase CoaBC [Collinsella intestinalis]MDM8162342.1 bifunctional phosphopantothenoylcysteine decarboxylase/phosphopantothenate--cysteine ligase CoaBC [Collinsella intestinalis]